MEFNEYQEKALTTAAYPNRGDLLGLLYTSTGLGGETGEVLEKIKKYLRDTDQSEEDFQQLRENLRLELGDILWYVANMAYELKLELEDIAEANVTKLASRKERNKLHGSGDNR